MAQYSFLKEATLYLVKNNAQHLINISNVSFNQTFTEETYKVQNLHNSDIFEGSVIVQANPANFSFTCFVLQEAYHREVFDSLINISTFDLYVKTEQDTFKLEKCVATNGNFTVSKGAALTLEVSGESSKLSRVGSSSYTIPGTLQPRAEKTYLIAKDNSIVLNNIDISEHTSTLSLELQNEISWIPYKTLNAGVSGAVSYPLDFSLEKRTVAGSILRYITPDTDSDVQTYSTSSSLRIKIGQEIGGTFYGFDFNMGSCSYTNRITTGAIFTQNYDWRMTDNSTSLDNIINYITT